MPSAVKIAAEAHLRRSAGRPSIAGRFAEIVSVHIRKALQYAGCRTDSVRPQAALASHGSVLRSLLVQRSMTVCFVRGTLVVVRTVIAFQQVIAVTIFPVNLTQASSFRTDGTLVATTKAPKV